MADLDKAARYVVKQDPPGFFTWLWRQAVTPLRFHSWYDARRLARPGEGDRTCDTVAGFRLWYTSTSARTTRCYGKRRSMLTALPLPSWETGPSPSRIHNYLQ